MKPYEARSIFNDFLIHFNDFIVLHTLLGEPLLGHDLPGSVIKALVLPRLVEIAEQKTFLNIETKTIKKNLLADFLHVNNKYSFVDLGSNGWSFMLPENDFAIDLLTASDPHQFYVKKLFHSTPSKFLKEFKSLVLLKHFHFDDDFYLHLHELGGRPGNRKPCPLGANCAQLAKVNSDEDIFKSLGVPYFIPAQRTIKNLEIIKGVIFAY